MSYKLTRTEVVIRLADGAYIPNDPRNMDRQEYQRWLDVGNVPQPRDADPVPLDLSDVENLDKAFRAMGRLIAQYTGKTPLQVRQDFMTIYRGLPA